MLDYPTFDFDQVDFVTSDQHFSHARISELAERPFATVEEMNAELVRRWNEVVRADDTVLHLGDLALARDRAPEPPRTLRPSAGHRPLCE